MSTWRKLALQFRKKMKATEDVEKQFFSITDFKHTA